MPRHSSIPWPAPLVAWRQVVATLDAIADPRQLEAALDTIEATHADFPEALRLAPGRWIRALMEGRSEPRLRVCRTVDIALHDVDIPGDRLAWTDAPELARITTLRVVDGRLDDDGVARWLGSANNPHLTELALAGDFTSRAARTLAGDDRLANLRSLALFRSRIGPEGIAATIASPRLGAGLRRLLFGRNALGNAGAEALGGATEIAELTLLDLDCNRLDGECIRALVRAPLLRGVRTLNLSNNPIGIEGCAALAACPQLGTLEQLFLHGCKLDDAAVNELLRAPFMPRLRNLALSDNRLSLASVEQIAGLSDLELEELDICHNQFGKTDAEATLRGAPSFAGLRRLCL